MFFLAKTQKNHIVDIDFFAIRSFGNEEKRMNQEEAEKAEIDP